MRGLSIDYAKIMARTRVKTIDARIQHLRRVLPTHWRKAYDTMSRHKTGILHFEDHGFEYLFDLSSPLSKQGGVQRSATPDDRVVVVYGRSQGSKGKRDASRMRGFLGGGLKIDEKGSMDKGHFVGHGLGGGLDVNLFPQKTDVNRYWSESGKVYGKMERYCRDHLDTFFFSRPIYSDETWVPSALEYGILLEADDLWVERFPN